MCTVVIDVETAGSARLLAVRDEDPHREWDALGPWWPEQYPGVIGIRDRRAGGAWLAVNPQERRLAVLLNRADVNDLPGPAASRGSLPLESVSGRSPQGLPRMHGFNLLEVGPDGARVVSWDGATMRETPVTPGTHMIAHDDLDDEQTPRITAWLPEFRALGPAAASADWVAEWTALLGASAELSPEDDRAIIRDNRPHGYPTQSLLYAVAAVTPAGVEVRDVTLPSPAHWTA
ncbi:NRDE family protein [Microbacterium sp. SSW1-47]|uniref:NRDE family protein n=1 Tax=Microbacterium sufflavum TaxID=2851649 RepID=UPI001FFD5E5D|nr:NRDE family protein [Microbacterium sufflavum]MCK2025398.1 NRDE family protein [Microbacterium sufflavum]